MFFYQFFFLVLALNGLNLSVQAENLSVASAEKEGRLCYSTQEYIEAFEFLRSKKVVSMSHDMALIVADQTSRGCGGAAKRLRETYLLLSKMGVSHVKALEIAIEFSQLTPEVQKNFFELLKHSYLREFLDYNFNKALKIAYEFSKGQKIYHDRARNDFLSLVNFCMDSNKISVPLSACGQVALELVRLSPYYSEGIFKPFQKLYGKLRARENLNLSAKDLLEVTVRVLKYGPRASSNFFEGYNYALSKVGLAYSSHKALEFALRMARRSFKGSFLPVAKSEEEKIAREEKNSKGEN